MKFANLNNFSKALRKTEFSKLFVFKSFRNVRLTKFGNFSEKNGIFELAKFSRKSLEKSSDIDQNCMSILKILKRLHKTLFLGKNLEKVEKSLETRFSEHWEISENCTCSD